jgi:hypothetical protein
MIRKLSAWLLISYNDVLFQLMKLLVRHICPCSDITAVILYILNVMLTFVPNIFNNISLQKGL